MKALHSGLYDLSYIKMKTFPSENQDDLGESLRKLIMEKFDGKRGEFFEWSQTILDEVV